MRSSVPRRATRLVATAAALAGVALSLLVSLGAPAQVAASCALPPGQQPPEITDYEIVLVGTVRATSESDRWATVAVEEVWRGPELPAQVLVKGGPGGDMFTSADRTFKLGERYLFTLNGAADAETLEDTACSGTRVWSDDLAALRPADARTVAVTETGSLDAVDVGELLTAVLVVLVVAGALLGAGLAVRGRES